MSNNYHSEELFRSAYCDRKPDFYAGLLSTVVAYGKPGTIIDLGAGTGLFTELAYQWGLNVVGVEGSVYAVNEVHSRVPNLGFIKQDLGDALPFQSNSVCNIVLHQVIEHIDMQRLNNLLSECERVMKPDGRLFVYSPSKRNIKEKYESTHINMMLPSDLANIIKVHGLRVLYQPNQGLWFLPSCSSRFIGIFSRLAMKLLKHDWISATANAIAVKPN